MWWEWEDGEETLPGFYNHTLLTNQTKESFLTQDSLRNISVEEDH